MYRLYKVVGGERGNAAVIGQITSRFNQLVDWVENGNPAPASTAITNPTFIFFFKNLIVSHLFKLTNIPS